MKREFEGIIPPVTTPFDEDEEINLGAFRRNLEKYARMQLSGVLVAGSTGESPHLTAAEKMRLVETAIDVWPRDRHLLVGVSATTVRHALESVSQLKGAPIDALLVSAPSYFKNRMNSEALGQFYLALAEHSPFPLLLYNIPQYSGIELGADLVARLAAHPNVIGMKDSSGNMFYLQRILRATMGTEFQVVSGSADTFAPALSLGIRAGIYAVACAFPEVPLAVWDCFPEPAGELAATQLKLFRFASTLVGKTGIPGIKFAMDLRGFEGLHCRRPLLPLSPAEQAEVEALVKEV